MKKPCLIFIIMLTLCSSAEARDVAIGYPAYGVRKVVYFDEKANKHEITDAVKILSYLKNNVDFLIDGRLSGNNYMPATRIPSAFYLHGSCFIPYMLKYPKNFNYPICRLIAQNNTWKMKFNGAQLFRYGYECFELLDISNLGLQNAMAAHIKSVLSDNRFFKGVFLDETAGHLNCALWGCRRITETAVVRQIEKDKTVKVIPVKNAIVTASQGDCSKITVTKADGTSVEIAGVLTGKRLIFIKSTMPAGETVTVAYLSKMPWNCPSDEEWTLWTTQLLSKIRQEIGNKLIIYNGTLLDQNYDSNFLHYADGCMREGFVDWGIDSEDKWKQDIERLAAISKNKMYFALVVCNKKTDADILNHMWFSYASFLLGKGEKAYYGFGLESNCAQEFYFNTKWNIDVGKPLESYHEQKPHVYERTFTNAYAVVNMADQDETVKIPVLYAVKNNNTIVDTIKLGPKSGTVLYKLNDQL